MHLEWSKIKNIILLMLAIVNLFLLLLVTDRESKSAQYQEDTRAEVVSILEDQNIQIDPQIIPENMELTPMQVKRDMEAEAAQVAALLGQVTQDNSEGTVTYDGGERGTAKFYANGYMDVSLNLTAFGGEVSDPVRFGLDALEKLGFDGYLYGKTQTAEAVLGGESVTVWQLWEGNPVFSCSVTITCSEGSGGAVMRLSGQRLIGTPVAVSGQKPLSVVTILMRFLASKLENGLVCNEITGITPGYTFSTDQTNPMRLVPAWRIAADSSVAYYLDAETGDFLYRREETMLAAPGLGGLQMDGKEDGGGGDEDGEAVLS